ncbi:MAG: alanine racemase [Candidatus Pacebacteria bacterium]|nr:alanine racemase [Candidatus Paceibacterota bacterium]
MSIRTIAHSIKQSFDKHRPLVEVRISRKNLLHNLHAYQEKYPHLTFAPVLKSNAYGHGLAVIARLLDKENIAFFMVDSYYEARTLRRAGVRSRIVIMGYVRPEEIASSKLRDIDYGIVDIEQLRELARIAHKPLRIHLKIDTGMHRQGILPTDLDDAIKLIKSQPSLRIAGICSHFADADNSVSDEHTRLQVSTWNEAAKELLLQFPSIEYRHIAATKGVAFGDATHTNVGRIGIGLYGFDTSPDGSTELKPVLEMRSLITSIRGVPTGDFVGYNATFVAQKPLCIATVPVGYFEGIDRRLSNVGSLQVAGEAAGLAGRVSMNMCSINVTDLPEVKRGDVVTVISRNRDDDNSVERMAELANTTPYVILAHLPQHLKRVVE